MLFRSDISSKQQSQSVYEAILKVLVADATARISKNGTDALTSFAEGDLLKTMLMGLKRFTKYPPANVKILRRSIAQALCESNAYAL